MTDQVRINDDGQLEIERTWDGEPLYSPSTVQEGLFGGDAFQQMPGQLPIEEIEQQPCSTCGGKLRQGGLPCEECGKVAAVGQSLYLRGSK